MPRKTENTKSSRLTLSNRNLLAYVIMIAVVLQQLLSVWFFAILSLHHACRVCKYMVAVNFDFHAVSNFYNDK